MVAMLRFLFRASLASRRFSCRSSSNGTVSAAATPHLTYHLHLKSLSITTTTGSCSSEYPVSSTHYLVSSLGLSPESALKIPKNKQIYLKSTSNADSVLALFRAYGFTPSHMAKVFFKCPALLSSRPQRNLRPKLDFFIQMGISGDALFHILTNDPSFLTRSLSRKIAPFFNFLNAFFNGDNPSLVSHLTAKHGTRLLSRFSATTTAHNVETLRRFGVPDSKIVRIMRCCGSTLSRDTEGFNEICGEIKEMGFDPSRTMFVVGVLALAATKKVNWVSKMEVFKKRFGWTDQQVLALFVKQPQVMAVSEERLKEALELFTKRLYWTADDIAKCPRVVNSNLQRRVLPRYSVLETLMSRGLLKRTRWASAYVLTEDEFLRRFVYKYQQDIPQLLDIYQEKMK